MERKLRILLVEDSEDDVVLLTRHLSDAGCRFTYRRVDTASGMREALAMQEWDVVISDWSMPRFSARDAFVLLKETGVDIPFIIISGTIGEETAVEAMRTGVHDFFVKGRLARLMPAIERELRDAETRRSRVAMGEALRRQREETIRLEAEREQAQRESEFKSKFLANMSHELRTPLNAIIGFSELLQQEIPDPLTLVQKEYVENVVEAAQHLLSLIDDILDLAKIDAGRLDLRLERTSVAVSVDAARGALRTLANKRGVQLEFDVPADLPEIDADPVRIKQILYNLLSNALKFTPSGGHVRLAVNANGEQLGISVVDTGIGIAAEDLPRLFQEFGRIESGLGAGVEGTGLGLALTRKLILLHGGSISVESSPGKGSAFTVLLPTRHLLLEEKGEEA